ncbi:hypothetical protein GV794_01795 [Nocardia cyriacigeorgica]|uniref:Uncharacterized protein n=1 Tax=Nocardia cyriacigeorgica TaxID=135487 RepID=A0ABX0CCW0_9NOCA|nr:hypothetical protein [Nocardia cyriacigeorgica]NEW40757.1 hypothetical protein [Nocardia cyriacigeorgica]NEW51016.1 hypothetical protein [Nocardia cyriacigeorgica]NEW54400.1 hypothetical protein [Nocardia cyriacigeorgica]
MTFPVDPREPLIMKRLAKARAAFDGSKPTYIGGGRRSDPTEAYRRAQSDLHAARQARNRLLVDLVGDADAVPIALAKRLGLTGREAVHVIETARSGTKLLRSHVLGSASGD